MTSDPTSSISDQGFNPALFANVAAEGRSCGTCTLCCKVYDVPSLSKPAGKWCPHCLPGKGCGIHQTRPDHCRSFFCLWMTDNRLPPEWKPERSRFVMSIDPGTRFLNVQVDPGSPNAWRAEPYLAQLRQMAARLMPEQRFVVILVNKSATILLPDREQSLGLLAPNDRVVPYRQMTPRGETYTFEVVRAAP
jgi:hypothetical protein